jgi:DNA-binding NtrC family response regulator
MTDQLMQESATMPRSDDAFARIVTADEPMRRIFGYLTAVARTGQPMLITGETGTGKDLVARALHALGGSAGDFVTLHVGCLDEAGLAAAMSPARAAGGTLCLVEFGDLSPASQIWLLRLLQERESAPPGNDGQRIVVASSRDLRQLQERGSFRDDLFYRLKTHHVHLPPLRERRGDHALLVDHFVAEAAQALKRSRPHIPAELVRLLERHPFPGNVRELRSLVFDAVSRGADGQLPLDALRQALADHDPREGARTDIVAFPSSLPTLREVQDLLVAEALRRSSGNQAMAAGWLGITRQGLNKRLRGRKAGVR